MTECKEYKRRWLMLLLFFLCSTSNSMHWLQYSIIANIMMRYYDVSSLAINWTSIIYEACYMPFVFPASWLLQHKGLRITLISGAAMMTVGSWIKALFASAEHFFAAFIGQAVVGTAQIFILGLPARLAAVWFPARQVSTACSLGVFGNQVGVALSFLIPPIIVHNHDSLDDIGEDLSKLNYILAAGPTIMLILVLIFFEKEPPTPAQLSEADKKQVEQTYLQSVKSLLTNKNFVLLFVSYGIIVGVYYAVSTLLNQMVLLHFPGAEQDAGRIGLCMVLAGVLGLMTSGVILDKTHKFKESTLIVYLVSLVAVLVFAFSFSTGMIWFTYFAAACMGFFMIGFLTIGYEFAAELTYPIPEGTSSGILNFSGEVFGILLTLAEGQVLNYFGDMTTNIALACCLLVGLLLSMLIDGKDLRRQAANTPEKNTTSVATISTATTEF
ncbi:hypothetical protein L9F63_000660 [Diploptera punctata]|uniref:Major facilitator superfamily (MFS) profile domain-containing protein n=1 Tax=Diploptera punctata TaxID=6984 RepID=A0AAD8ALA3_DIPPU|nr:hypothetical protein L9F63_000660 [Diploptera punctata]